MASLCPLFEKYRKHIELLPTKITSHFTIKTVNLLHERAAFSVMQLQTWKNARTVRTSWYLLFGASANFRRCMLIQGIFMPISVIFMQFLWCTFFQGEKWLVLFIYAFSMPVQLGGTIEIAPCLYT